MEWLLVWWNIWWNDVSFDEIPFRSSVPRPEHFDDYRSKYRLCLSKREKLQKGKTKEKINKKKDKSERRKKKEGAHFLLSRLVSIIASHRFASHLSTASLRIASNQSSASHLLRIASHLLRITSTSNHIYNFNPLTHIRKEWVRKTNKGNGDTNTRHYGLSQNFHHTTSHRKAQKTKQFHHTIHMRGKQKHDAQHKNHHTSQK